MTEDTKESYDSGEVVWVKLGSSWWPGEVKNAEELPSDVLDFKKPPLVIVKFFDEDSYEYVRTWTNIYPYNCEKKNEFIKKGMAAFRAKVPHMEKFPKDVLKAEEKLGGNPNILSNPMFLPEKKRNYAAEVFGTPSPKSNTPKNKRRSNMNKSSSKRDTSHITHRRFLGVDDYQAYICIQYPGKDRIPGDREDEEVIRINKEPEQDFNCHSCSFSTKRLEVMILHTKSHIQGVYLASTRKNKQTVSRRRKEKAKKSRSSDMMETDSSSSDSEPIRQKKRKPKSQGVKKTKIKKAEEEEPPKKDIRSELLEAWEDSEEEEEEELDVTPNESESAAEKSSKTLDNSSFETVPDFAVNDSVKKSDTVDTLPKKDGGTAQINFTQNETASETSGKLKPADGSVLEETESPSQMIEEALNDASEELNESYTQDEPKKSSAEEQLSTEKLLSTLEDDSLDNDNKRNKVVGETVQGADSEKEDVAVKDVIAFQKSDVVEEVSKQKMDKDMHEAIKSCFDFDEDEEEESTVVSKATSGRKIPRVIPKVSRKKSTEGIVDPNKKESEDMHAAFEELMEITSVPDLSDVQNTLKCEQNFHNIKTIKFPDKPEQVGSPPKSEKKESTTEVATKLTNPKKRFVKSFEDFELMQNEIRRREEEQLETSKKEGKREGSAVESEDTKTEGSSSFLKYDYLDNSEEQYSPDSNIQLSKLKSKIMSKIIEEAKINPASKSKIMSKMQDSKHKTAESEVNSRDSESEAKTTSNSHGKAKTEVLSGHRTPRSKILDSYRKDADKIKAEERSGMSRSEVASSVSREETVQDRLRDVQTDVVPPKKKNKWSRRGSHPKKDRNLLMLQDLVPGVPTTSEEKVEDQPPIESKDDSSKIDESRSSSAEDDIVPTGQVLEEIIEETVNEVQNTESQPTDLISSSLEIDENKSVVNNEKAVEESPSITKHITEDENQPSTNHTTAETKEGFGENEELITLKTIDETESVSQDGDQIVVEADLRFTEHAVYKEDEIPGSPAKDRRAEGEADLQPKDIYAVEASGSKDDSSAYATCLLNVPSKEIEIVDNNEPSSKGVDCIQEHIPEDSLIVSPVRDASSATLVPSPKSNKKRKLSDNDDITLKSNAVPESQSEDFPPLEKRTKEEENLEKEIITAASSPLKTFESRDSVQNSSEIILERRDLSENKEECTEEKVLEAEQMLGEKETEKSELEGQEIIEMIEDAKRSAEGEEPGTVTEQNIDAKKADGDKTEKIASSAESEVAPEKSKDVEWEKEVNQSVKEHNNEVEIHCASSSVDSFKFSIQTNLSILSSREEMSALALATLSEIKADLETNEEVVTKEKEEKMDHAVVPPSLLESEMVPIEGNLTVVSEKDLGDGQVEITSEQVISPKRPVTLSNFSLDFSDSLSDSNSNSTTDTSSDMGKCDFNSKGTEFTAKALTKQMKKLDHKKESTYGRLELINILEGNSETDRKPKEFTHPPKKTSMVEDICDFEEHIPSQIVCAKNLKKEASMDSEREHKEFKDKEKTSKTSVKSTTSKLLERLTTESKAKASAVKVAHTSDSFAPEGIGKLNVKNQNITGAAKSTKSIGKPKVGGNIAKPIILSEQIVKPAPEQSKGKMKSTMEDIEDVEAFVIHKDPHKINFEEEEAPKSKSVSVKSAGKAKILQQTIITPAGEIIQPTVTDAQTDDNIFDINSMPIVLSDEILTPESIEKMPIVISGDAKNSTTEKIVKRPAQSRIFTTVGASQAVPNRTVAVNKQKTPRILQTIGNKAIKTSPLLPNTAKPGKYIIVPQSSIPPTKYLAKKPTIVKKNPVATGVVQKVPNISPEPSGNKIMIVTNQQGQQQRLLLTPAQQKMLGYQNQKVSKTIVKGNVIQKSVLATKSVPLVEAGTSGVVTKTPTIIGQKVIVGTNPPQGLITTTTSHQVISVQGRTGKTVPKKSPVSTQKLATSTSKPQKTILIKNQHGQTVRKIQGTDDELLDKQVAEQLKAIKASSGMKFSSQQKLLETDKSLPKTAIRRSYSKRVETKPRGPPPLSGIQQPFKQETVVSGMPTAGIAKKPESIEAKTTPTLSSEEAKVQQPERPLNQLVIQDAVGNQTTITEGQILALPSETVDGQPQSYMLVTLDESGNLTPLNSEALMSLDPNLGLGGDIGNMVLQIDQGALADRPQATAIIKPPEAAESAKPEPAESAPQTIVPVPEASITTEITETVPEQKIVPAAETLQTISPTSSSETGQQLIVTGDPIATQKFLESLTEGTTDLANILANAEGNSILIQADGQQILINTNTDNQMLLSMNSDNANITENSEAGGNPIFATQPNKNQDILAAALADTDVFQQEHPSSTQGKIGSQLSPNNTLYPMNVSNVLETSLTLSSPIMTPLEVPSTNNKKIPDDEADILTQVPKNVDLPITITDPNISQTVANQQVSQMIANELQTNLELALPISDSTASAVSTEMNSPSYVYSLPTLDDSVEINQKPFNGSMPLLNEDEEPTHKEKAGEEEKSGSGNSQKDKSKCELSSEGFLGEGEEESRFTLGGEMCSSLSEPPPEMFDLPESTPDVSDNASKDDDTTDLSQADTSSEGSCEIPLQPQIVTKSLELSRNLESLKRSLDDETEGENKKCKFD